MKKIKPKVSVIIPVYNVEDYVERCLDSVINQTYQNLEIILVNDGSTDDSGKICDEYAEKDDRIVVKHKENGGVSSARNLGMDICVGDYIAFVDPDDYIHPITYDACVKIFFKEDVDYVEFDINYISQIIDFQELNLVSYELHNQEELIYYRIKNEKHYVFSFSKLFKRDFILNFTYSPYHIAEDDFLFNQYAFKANKVAYIPLKFYYYYLRQGSAMRKTFTIEHTNCLKARLELYQLLKNRYSNLLELQLKSFIDYFYQYLNTVTAEKKDLDLSIRYTLINILLENFDDLMNSEIVTRNQRNDFILAQTMSNKFIEKHEKGIVRK